MGPPRRCGRRRRSCGASASARDIRLPPDRAEHALELDGHAIAFSRRSSAAPTDARRLPSRSYGHSYFFTAECSSLSTATYVSPTFLPGVAPPGPAMPVMPRPIFASSRSRAPRASAPATTDETAPCPWIRFGATSARMVLASFEYTTAPPLKNSLDPPCAVRTAERSPPVQDSATATVSLRRRSREWIAPMRSSSSGSVGGRLFGTQHESDAREHGERGRGQQQRVRGRGEPGGRPRRRREQQSDRRDLQDRLGFAVRCGGKGVRRSGADLDGDELASQDEDDRPGGRDPPNRERRKCSHDEDLVRERIQRRTKRGCAAAPSCEGPVQRVRGGGAEEDEQRQPSVARRDETDDRDDEESAGRGQHVRERHCATKTRSTTSPCRPSPAISWPL